MLRLVAAVFAMLLLNGAATGAEPENRVALVIGNAAYKQQRPLSNPVNDATAMAGTLRRLGFDVVSVTDADRTRMVKALGEFRKKLRTDGIGLFYYAGHAVQVRGKNYMLPVDADISSENDVRLLAFDQESVQNELEDAGVRLSLLIFDACRDNPFERRFRSAGSRGLAAADAARGTVIAYATAPGKTADDGDSGNGLYTAELLKMMAKPGLGLEEVFKQTAAAVERASGNKQTPWYNSAFHGNFYFNGPIGVNVPPPAAPAVDREAMFWDSVKSSQDMADFQAYLKQFPDGTFAPLARNRLAALRPPPAAPPPAVAPATPKPGETFRDCADCPEMVWLPPGQFMMGTETSEQDSFDDERPRHAVTVRSPFAVGKYHVTRAEYARFVAAAGHTADTSWFNLAIAQTDRDPVVNVNWDDAKAYAAWLSRTTGKTYRLLTEAEWEYAARAGTTTVRYWGDAIGSGNANCDGCGSRWDAKSTSPVGSFKRNAFGLYDMLGNASQWTEDCWNESYLYVRSDSSTALATGDCDSRVLRGGSWAFNQRGVRVGFRLRSVTGSRTSSDGFRVARTQ